MEYDKLHIAPQTIRDRLQKGPKVRVIDACIERHGILSGVDIHENINEIIFSQKFELDYGILYYV